MKSISMAEPRHKLKRSRCLGSLQAGLTAEQEECLMHLAALGVPLQKARSANSR
jgi:hypothetical protein